ncbi:MAG: tetratricopeptide repeat protein [Pseudomonadota bacterium]|jgi:tetratricopeptide (TPR) repeat protein
MKQILHRTRIVILVFSLLIATPGVSQSPDAPSGSLSSEEPLLDPFDPFDLGDSDPLATEKEDLVKSAEALLREATGLLISDRPLDARTKLLRALKRDPNLYRTHYLLAGYYLIHVGHFRLAMKYIKQAELLFEKENGLPPYSDHSLQLEHANIIYYQSQIRLSLDNYAGALESLDRYANLGYVSEWYPGSRAWVLMKLGRIQEAITVARAGILASAEPGRTLNMLGILLSMNGQPQEALEVFRQAIANEYSSGSDGQPATPLNNSGEVYKEMFEDDKAESSFLRAISLPDGCEHVLPSLNLVLLYIEQLKLDAARSTLDGFERCVAQFPLRNNEEHAALVQLARGRIALHSGAVDKAIEHFRSALDGTQWFGKIGTNQNDLMVAATISLGQALDRKANVISSTVSASWVEWLEQLSARTSHSLESWWLLRRARQMLSGELNDIEDLQIRNTDSLLEYPTLGEVLSGFSARSLQRRIKRESDADNRAPAKLFYQLYGAEADLGMWSAGSTLSALDSVIEGARPRYDELLRTHATLKRLKTLPTTSARYHEMAYRVFFTTPALLRNYGLPLPIRIDHNTVSRQIQQAILSGPFIEVRHDTTTALNSCIISGSNTNGTQGVSLSFTCPGQTSTTHTVEDSAPESVVNKLSSTIFSSSSR